MKSRLLSAALLGIVVTACGDDPAAPTGCDAPHGCEIEGLDLAVLEAELRFDDDQPFHDEVDARVVEPGDAIELRVRIVNRGTVRSPAAVVHVHSESVDTLARGPIASLDVGEEEVVSVDVVVPDMQMWHDLLYDVAFYITTDTSQLFLDAVDGNDYAPIGTTLAFHPLVPILEVQLELPDTVSAYHPYLLTGTVRNHSPFVASPDLPIGLCVVPATGICSEPDGPLASSGVVGTSSTRDLAIGLTTTPEWPTDLNHPEIPVSILVCFPDVDGWSSGRSCDVDTYTAVVVPNLAEQCEAPPLVAPTTFDAEDDAATCQLGSFIQYLWALDAEAGETFRFTAQADGHNPIEVYDGAAHFMAGDGLGTPFEFTAPETARYYLLTGDSFGDAGAPVLIEKL